MFMNAALLLQSFFIEQDPKHPINTLAFKHGVITQPGPFVAKFTVRNPGGAEALLRMVDT
jgi:hypothetical protein